MADQRTNKSSGAPSTDVKGMTSKQAPNPDLVGFVTSGYIDKQDTPFGEAARFNHMPPGMDITNQAMTEQYTMPLKTLVGTSYPGDGWGSSKDVPE